MVADGQEVNICFFFSVWSFHIIISWVKLVIYIIFFNWSGQFFKDLNKFILEKEWKTHPIGCVFCTVGKKTRSTRWIFCTVGKKERSVEQVFANMLGKAHSAGRVFFGIFKKYFQLDAFSLTCQQKLIQLDAFLLFLSKIDLFYLLTTTTKKTYIHDLVHMMIMKNRKQYYLRSIEYFLIKQNTKKINQ